MPGGPGRLRSAPTLPARRRHRAGVRRHAALHDGHGLAALGPRLGDRHKARPGRCAAPGPATGSPPRSGKGPGQRRAVRRSPPIRWARPRRRPVPTRAATLRSRCRSARGGADPLGSRGSIRRTAHGLESRAAPRARPPPWRPAEAPWRIGSRCPGGGAPATPRPGNARPRPWRPRCSAAAPAARGPRSRSPPPSAPSIPGPATPPRSVAARAPTGPITTTSAARGVAGSARSPNRVEPTSPQACSTHPRSPRRDGPRGCSAHARATAPRCGR